MSAPAAFFTACVIAIGAMACAPPYAGSGLDTKNDEPASKKTTKGGEDSTTDTEDGEDGTTDTEDGKPGGKTDAPSTVTYVGTMASTQAVRFGGAPYCTFSVAMKNVVVDLDLREGGVVSAKVTNTMVEGIEDSCPYELTPPKAHAYTFSAEAEPVAIGESLTMIGQSTNLPKTALTIDTKKNGERYDVILTWTRTDDQPANLLWKVSAPLTLKKS